MDHIGENIALVLESEFYNISKFEKRTTKFLCNFLQMMTV